MATTRERLTAYRRSRFVGRAAESELFRSALDVDGDPPFSVLHIHGPGGIGKTSLLDVLGDLGSAAGASVVRLDGGDVDLSPTSLLAALDEHLEVAPDDGPIAPRAGEGRLVLLVDSYESISALDDWFRERLVARLPASTITVIASRDAPLPGWRAEPAWGDLLRVVSLRNLDPDDSRTLLRKAGIDRLLHERILRITYGHPLGLALMADAVARGGRVPDADLPPDLVEVLLPRFVETVPDRRRRRALEACALAWRTTEPLLREVLEEDDVHDVFAWLRDLSFVESRREGLVPHDLARDVLDADLRWRDFESYQDVFRRVRGHSVSALRTTSGRRQQRAIADLKFLFRHVRTALSPVQWGSWGEHYPEGARPGDRQQLLELVRAWEGAESAAIAARWLDRQPAGFSVLREQDGEILGVLAILDLTQAAPDDVTADPATRAAWAYAHRSAPPRAGETITQCRFVIDRDAYQGPSPTLNAAPILTLQKELSTPNLSWDFLTLAEPDRWNEYFAAADLPRAEGADFEVGGRRYGLFAHDFRKVPVDAITELWTERALARDVDLGPHEHVATFLVLSYPDFEAAVRQGFKDLRRPDLLAGNPLLRTRLVADRADDQPVGPATLEAVLREAAASLVAHPRDDKLLRALDRTYLRPAPTQEAAAELLGLPFSTYRRHLTQGMARLVAALWDQEVHGAELSRNEHRVTW